MGHSGLPLGDSSTFDASANVRGIGMSSVPGRLHYIHVQTDLVTV